MVSILRNTQSFINFYILDNCITNCNKKILEEIKKEFNNFTIEYINIAKYIEEYFNENKMDIYYDPNRISLDAYSRLFIPNIKRDLEKIIYLDVDLIVVQDIKKLYDIDLGSYTIGAVSEYYNIDYSIHKFKLMDIIPQQNDKKEFNSGVLLIDCKKWREENIFDKLLKIQLNYGNKILQQDQGLLNKYFYNNYFELDLSCNIMVSGHTSIYDYKNGDLKNKLKVIESNPFIIHFCIHPKVWHTNLVNAKSIPYFTYWWYYAKKTPFYESMQNDFIAYNTTSAYNKFKQSTIKIFGVPVFNIKHKNNTKRYYLFNFIPILKIQPK
jgi:lipopolysaccharide biosynthesis glycosyltransferase